LKAVSMSFSDSIEVAGGTKGGFNSPSTSFSKLKP